jgi:hypothetical protein
MLPSLVKLEEIVGFLVCGVVGIFALIVLWRMFKGNINLDLLISEKTGEASMSRFQLLIFTFVIALSFFLIVVSNAKLLQTNENEKRSGGPVLPSLPDIPGGVLGLLGISASSYTVSKAIQTNMPPKTQGQATPPPPPPKLPVQQGAAGQT